MLIIDGDTVRRILPIADAITLMREAFEAVSSGTVRQPLRTMLRDEGNRVLAVMPATVRPTGGTGSSAVGLKAITVNPGNPARGLHAHHGLVLMFDPETGEPVAVVDAAAVTAVRTAAASAVATDLLARDDARVLAVIGSGVQARSHVEAMVAVRQIREIRVWSRDPEHARQLTGRVERSTGIPASVAGRVGDATAGADIVCTTTSSAEPLVNLAMLDAGTHVNAVGSSFPDKRELDTDVVTAGGLFVDSRESALREAGELLIPMPDPEVASRFVRGEIGEVLLGSVPGRADRDELTVFTSLGLAVQDVLCGAYLYRRATEIGAGVTVSMSDHAKVTA